MRRWSCSPRRGLRRRGSTTSPRSAGISKGAVYLYFPSKEAILEGLVRRAVTPIADHALGMINHFEGDPRFAVSMVMKMIGGRLVRSQSCSRCRG